MRTYHAYTAREDAKALRKKGLSYWAIGDELGCSVTQARKLCLFQMPSFTRSSRKHRVIKEYKTI